MQDEMNQRSEILMETTKALENFSALDMSIFVTEFVKFTDAIKPLYLKYCIGEKTDFIMKL